MASFRRKRHYFRKDDFHLRLNYSSRTILDEEIEHEENPKDKREDEDQDEVHVDVNNEIIETWMILDDPSLVKFDQ